MPAYILIINYSYLLLWAMVRSERTELTANSAIEQASSSCYFLLK